MRTLAQPKKKQNTVSTQLPLLIVRVVGKYLRLGEANLLIIFGMFSADTLLTRSGLEQSECRPKLALLSRLLTRKGC
jgi:hypothetical protein